MTSDFFPATWGPIETSDGLVVVKKTPDHYIVTCECGAKSTTYGEDVSCVRCGNLMNCGGQPLCHPDQMELDI